MKILKTRVPPELVQELSERFPEKCPEVTDSEREIFLYAGQRKLVRFLEQQVNEQSEDNLKGVKIHV